MSLYLGKTEIPGVNIKGVSGDHNGLINRELPDQHPIQAITGLEDELNNKLNLSGGAMRGDLNMNGFKIANLPEAIRSGDPVTFKQLQEAIAGIGTVFNLKGSKPTYSQLPTSGNKIGDVWYVEDESVGYIWIEKNGTPQWEKFGPAIDLSNYLEKSSLEQTTGNDTQNAMSQDAVTKALEGKQPKNKIVTFSGPVQSLVPSNSSQEIYSWMTEGYQVSALYRNTNFQLLGGVPGQSIFQVNGRDTKNDSLLTKQIEIRGTQARLIESTLYASKVPAIAPPEITDVEDANAQTLINSLAKNKADKKDIPTKLRNPEALTFTGAVTGNYDGSQPLTVNIPEGGPGGKPYVATKDGTPPDNQDIFWEDESDPGVQTKKLTFTGAVEAEYDGSSEVTVNIPQGGGGGPQVQSDWNVNDETNPAFIKNHPNIHKGKGENSESFNDISFEKAIGKNSHIEGGQTYLKEYKNVTVSNINATQQTYEITVDINKDVFPHIMKLYQNGILQHSLITKSYDKTSGFIVTSYSDISGLIAGTYDIEIVSGFAIGDRSHVEGNNNIANARESHVEGWNNMVTSWTDGNGKKIGDGVAAHAEGRENVAIGRASHVEGRMNKAIGAHSHAEGGPKFIAGEMVIGGTTASGDSSHAEGGGTTASGWDSHAEGSRTTASGDSSHAEGGSTTASGGYSHAEGRGTTASGWDSHAEGRGTTASGWDSHAEGSSTTASGVFSHAEGENTTASSDEQHVQGRWNIDDAAYKYAHIVGNGFSTKRSNAHTLDWEGNSWYQSDVLVGGANMDDPAAISLKKTSESVANKLSKTGHTPNKNLVTDTSGNVAEADFEKPYVIVPSEQEVPYDEERIVYREEPAQGCGGAKNASELPAVVPEGLTADPNTQSILNAIAAKIGGGGTVTHIITYQLTNCTSSNKETVVISGTEYTTNLSPDSGFTLGDPIVIMGGSDITSQVWNKNSAQVAIPSVTGSVTITCAGVKSPGIDTSPKIAEYGKVLNSTGGTVGPHPGYEQIKNGCYTEFYNLKSDKSNVILYYANPDDVSFAEYGKFQYFDSEKQTEYWSIGHKNGLVSNFKPKVGSTRWRTTLVSTQVDNCYAYDQASGDIYFAGKNTEYYGKSNINDKDGVPKARMIDMEYAGDAMPEGKAVTPSDYPGLTAEYVQMVSDNYNAMMAEARGDYNKIPFALHTDQHGRATKSPVFALIGDLADWYEISKCINLGDTSPVTFSESALQAYLDATRDHIPYSKRLEVYGNHDVWDADEAHKYDVDQKRLSPYFKNIYGRRHSNNGYFTVIDSWYNVKYLVASDYEYKGNSSTRQITTPQANFIVDELSKDDGYDIILAAHQPLDANKNMTSRDPSYAPYVETFISDPMANASLLAMIKARHNFNSGTFRDSEGVDHPYDFSNLKSKLLTQISGHAHFEAYYTLPGSITEFVFDWFDKNTFYWGYIDRKAMKLVVWKNALDAGNGRLEVQLT